MQFPGLTELKGTVDVIVSLQVCFNSVCILYVECVYQQSQGQKAEHSSAFFFLFTISPCVCVFEEECLECALVTPELS